MTQDQYVGTNIETLIEGLQSASSSVPRAVDDFTRTIYDIDTAASAGLDIWGAFLKFPRYVKANESGGYLELSDEQYRVILKLLAVQTKTNATIPEINGYLKIILGEFGEAAYIKDPQDMTFVAYVFLWELPKWLYNIFTMYNVLPRPMGVGVKITEAYANIIGFKGQRLGNFYKSIFYKGE